MSCCQSSLQCSTPMKIITKYWQDNGMSNLFSSNCQIDHHCYSFSRSYTLKASTVKCQSTVSRESTYFCRHAIECWWIHMSWMTPCQLSNNCRLSVDQDDNWVLTENQSSCQSRVNRDVNEMWIEGWSRVSVATWWRMPLLNMIHFS